MSPAIAAAAVEEGWCQPCCGCLALKLAMLELAKAMDCLVTNGLTHRKCTSTYVPHSTIIINTTLPSEHSLIK